MDESSGPQVCVVGSANVDLVASASRLPGPGETVLGTSFAELPGGKGLNQAVASARSGARTAFVGVVGHDAAAIMVRAVLASDHIDDRALDDCEAPTGRALIGVSEAGENAIIVVPGANARLGPGHVTAHGVTIARAAVVLAQLEVPLEAVIAAFEVARAVGATTILNPAPATPLPRELLMLTDICVPNEHEAALLGGAEQLRQAGVGIVVVTEGERGSTLYTDSGTVRIAPFAVEPIDTTAAGDSFCGALAARLALGDRLPDALRWASAAGALATTVQGAVPSVPHHSAIERLIARR